jgi:hypothetical protein
MTVTERQRLEENYRLYRDMPPAERDRLRQLQREIDSDPELNAAFHEYQLWADSLSPVDRHELRQAQDPKARRQLIEKFRRRPSPDMPPSSDRPPNGQLPFGPNFIGRGDRPRLFEKLFGRSVLLAGDRLASFVPEMEAIIQVLEKELPSESQGAALSSLDPLSRKVRVLRLTLERHPNVPSAAMRLFGPPGSGTFEKVLAAMPDGQVKQFAANRNPGPLMQRNMMLMALTRGLMTEMQRHIEDHRPNPETLRRYQDKLPEAERKRLEGLNREDHQLELQLLYLKEHVPGIVELQQLIGMPEMERFFQEMIGQMRGGANSPEGDDRRNQKSRLPPLDGSVRPREPETFLPNRPTPKD